MNEGTGIPIVSIVGKSDSGKTTLMERVIRTLSGRGYRVASVKHHVHDFDIDIPGKDSWRHAHAGSAVSLVSSPSKLGMIRQMNHEATLEELLALVPDADILLTEGYRRAGDVRIEVSRCARSTELVCEPHELFALVTDNAELEVGDVPVFGLDDAEGLSDLVERTFLAGGAGGGRGSAASSAAGAAGEDCLSAGPSAAGRPGGEVRDGD